VEYVAVFEWLLDQHQLTAVQQETVHGLIALLEQQGLDWDRWVFSDEAHPFTTAGAASSGLPFDSVIKCPSPAERAQKYIRS
jgi:hypothetical protein